MIKHEYLRCLLIIINMISIHIQSMCINYTQFEWLVVNVYIIYERINFINHFVKSFRNDIQRLKSMILAFCQKKAKK